MDLESYAKSQKCVDAEDGVACLQGWDKDRRGVCVKHYCSAPEEYRLSQACGGKIYATPCLTADGRAGNCLQDPYRCIEAGRFAADRAQCEDAGRWGQCTTLSGERGECRSQFECFPATRIRRAAASEEKVEAVLQGVAQPAAPPPNEEATVPPRRWVVVAVGAGVLVLALGIALVSRFRR